MRGLAPFLLLSCAPFLLAGCGDDAAPDGSGGVVADGPTGPGPGADARPLVDGAPRPDGGGPSGGLAARVAARLGKGHFLIGMGNDLAGADEGWDHDRDGAYTLGVTLDLHYCYLVGLPGQGGWPDWNSEGSFVNLMTDAAARHGVVPMFTLYAMAAWGDGNLSGLADAGYMGPYWEGAKLLFDRLALYGEPAVVHLEPDFWGYAQAQSGGDPASVEVLVGSLEPDCADLPDDLGGLGRCLVRLARARAPEALIGFHASRWAGAPAATVAFLRAVGAADTDLVFGEMLDRDAGCFEAHVDPNCQRTEGGWYWDETNATSPNFHEHLAWSGAITGGLALPMLWWQVPFGVPSDTPGGTAGHYRDNRVHYIFRHLDEFVAVDGLGVVFGTGAGNQTYITTDGGQFQDAVTGYFASPVPLP